MLAITVLDCIHYDVLPVQNLEELFLLRATCSAIFTSLWALAKN